MNHLLLFALGIPAMAVGLIMALLSVHRMFRQAEEGRRAENLRLKAQKRLTRDLVLHLARDVGSPAKTLLEKAQLHPGTADPAWQVLASAQEAMEWVESDASDKHFQLDQVNLFAIVQTVVAFRPASVQLEFMDYGTQAPIVAGAIVKVRKSLIKLVEYAAQLQPVRSGRITLLTTATHAQLVMDLGVATAAQPQTFGVATARNWIEAMGGTLEMGGHSQPSFTVTLKLTEPEPDFTRNPVTAPQRVVV